MYHYQIEGLICTYFFHTFVNSENLLFFFSISINNNRLRQEDLECCNHGHRALIAGNE